MTNGMMLDWNPFKPDFDSQKAKQIIDEFKQVRSFYLEDYYPLTPYSLEDDVWCVYQFHQSGTQQGIVLVFRRQNNLETEKSLTLQALDPTQQYHVELSDEDLNLTSFDVTGVQLLSNFMFKIPTIPGSILMKYKLIS